MTDYQCVKNTELKVVFSIEAKACQASRYSQTRDQLLILKLRFVLILFYIFSVRSRRPKGTIHKW